MGAIVNRTTDTLNLAAGGVTTTFYAATKDIHIHANIQLSGLNGNAASIMSKVEHYAADGTTLIGKSVTSTNAKALAADTVFEIALAAGLDLTIKSGEKVRIFFVSDSNALDTAATVIVDWVDLNAADQVAVLGTTLTESGTGYLAGSLTKFLNKQTPTGTINSLPDAVAGTSGGIFIDGVNAADASVPHFKVLMPEIASIPDFGDGVTPVDVSRFIAFIYQTLREKLKSTTSAITLYATDGTSPIAQWAITRDVTNPNAPIVTRGRAATPP